MQNAHKFLPPNREAKSRFNELNYPQTCSNVMLENSTSERERAAAEYNNKTTMRSYVHTAGECTRLNLWQVQTELLIKLSQWAHALAKRPGLCIQRRESNKIHSLHLFAEFKWTCSKMQPKYMNINYYLFYDQFFTTLIKISCKWLPIFSVGLNIFNSLTFLGDSRLCLEFRMITPLLWHRSGYNK